MLGLTSSKFLTLYNNLGDTMRHATPKYFVNQIVAIEFIGLAIIKGMRFEPCLNDSGKFTSDGWEYSIWRQVTGYPGSFQNCGWVKETDINKLAPATSLAH